MEWPYKSMKKVAQDRSYVDFLHRNADGSFSGIRVRSARCQFIRTEAGSGEHITVVAEGPPSNIPLAVDTHEQLQREQGVLAEDFPELELLLSGKMNFRNLFALD